MKTRMLSCVILALATLATSAYAGNPGASVPRAVSVRLADRGGLVVARGATVSDLRQALGVPLQTSTSASVWQYPGYYAEHPKVPYVHECTILVVSIADGHVADMKLMNPAAAKLAAKAGKAGKPIAYVPESTPTLLAGSTAVTPVAN